MKPQNERGETNLVRHNPRGMNIRQMLSNRIEYKCLNLKKESSLLWAIIMAISEIWIEQRKNERRIEHRFFWGKEKGREIVSEYFIWSALFLMLKYWNFDILFLLRFVELSFDRRHTQKNVCYKNKTVTTQDELHLYKDFKCIRSRSGCDTFELRKKRKRKKLVPQKE